MSSFPHPFSFFLLLLHFFESYVLPFLLSVGWILNSLLNSHDHVWLSIDEWVTFLPPGATKVGCESIMLFYFPEAARWNLIHFVSKNTVLDNLKRRLKEIYGHYDDISQDLDSNREDYRQKIVHYVLSQVQPRRVRDTIVASFIIITFIYVILVSAFLRYVCISFNLAFIFHTHLVTSLKLNLEELLSTTWKPWSGLLLRTVIVFGTLVIDWVHVYIRRSDLLEHYAYLVIADRVIRYMQNSSRRAEIENF